MGLRTPPSALWRLSSIGLVCLIYSGLDVSAHAADGSFAHAADGSSAEAADGSSAEAADGSSTETFWRLIGSAPSRGEIPRVLAAGSQQDRFALGDDVGVSIRRLNQSERAALVGVRDLAFDRDGTLWIATLRGIHRWAESERPVHRALRGGESANWINRVATSPSGMLVATHAGAFWSTSGKIFQLLAVGGTSGPVTLVAIEPEATPAHRQRVWILRAGQIFEIEGFLLDAGMRVTSSRELSLPRPMTDRQPVDLLVDPVTGRLLLVYEDVVASRSISSSERGDEALAWKIERPVLPPGAVIRRLAWDSERRFVIATDHGLVEGSDLGGSFGRSSHPLGSAECMDVRSGGRGLLMALCRRGVYSRSSFREPVSQNVFERTFDSPEGSLGPSRRLDPAPPLGEIRSRAIERSGLSVDRSRRLREGLHRRAFWPDLSLRLGADFDRDRQTDSDQSFLSGEKRFLFDRTHDRRVGIGALIEFDWELGGVAYPDDAVDLSRELRQVISLRDDVSDEINQLYFEREGIRERLESVEAIVATEVVRLHLRAREIDAGLDAWTGGWLSRWRSSRPLEAGEREALPPRAQPR